jgi:HlyD family type I secretion membrane fusion protein
MASASSNWRRPAIMGYAIIILTFGVLGGWSAFARLDSAVIAAGVVAVESSRKTVQHYEGGIIAEIYVREGRHVQEQELLFRLDDTPAKASVDIAQNQLFSNQALEARLIAEQQGADDVTMPAHLLDMTARPLVKQIIADQFKQFEERRASLKGQVSILEARREQLRTEIDGLKQERSATTRQLEFINQELRDLTYLLERNLVSKSRVLQLEREKSRLEGVIGRSTADMAKAENGIGEAELQIGQLRQKLAEEVNTALLEVRQKIGDLKEKVRVAEDVLRRLEIRAPRTGVVQNVRAATIGGVVRPGEALLDLVPEADELIVQAQVSPTDVDLVKHDMTAEVRFPSFHTEVLPVMFGTVKTMSRDRLVDDQTKQPYFLTRIVVDDANVPRQVRNRISAGMPVEVIIPTGERTVVDYLVRPLFNHARKAMREK